MLSAIESSRDVCEFDVPLCGFIGRTANDERSTRFIDKNRIHFVNNCEVMFALDAILEIPCHIVAEIVETEFVIGAVSDVRGILGPAFGW